MQYYFLNAQVLSAKNDLQRAAEAFNQLFDYEKQTGKKRYSKDAEPMLMSVIQKVSQRAINLYNNDKDFKNAANNYIRSTRALVKCHFPTLQKISLFPFDSDIEYNPLV